MITRGSANSSANFQTFSVVTSTPVTPLTTTAAESATRIAPRASMMKMPKPGVSRRLIFVSFHSSEGHGRGDGVLALDLIRIEVGDGRAVLDAAHARGRAGVEQQLRHERGFARVVVSDDRHVADLGARINLHEVDSVRDFKNRRAIII